MARVAEQRPAFGLLDGLAGVHDHDLVGHVGDDAQVVGDDDQRAAQPAEQFEDLGPDRRVQGRRRLVGDDQFGVEGHRHRDHHPLPHAAGELVRIVADPHGGDPDLLQPLRATAQAWSLLTFR